MQLQPDWIIEGPDNTRVAAGYSQAGSGQSVEIYPASYRKEIELSGVSYQGRRVSIGEPNFAVAFLSHFAKSLAPQGYKLTRLPGTSQPTYRKSH